MMHRKEHVSQVLPLKSMGLYRVCAGALRLIWALLFTEVSKTAAEKQGAQLPCHSVGCPRVPAAACHFAVWLCLPALLSCCENSFREKQGAACLEKSRAFSCIPWSVVITSHPHHRWRCFRFRVKYCRRWGNVTENGPPLHLVRRYLFITHPLLSRPPICSLPKNCFWVLLKEPCSITPP